MIIPTIYKMRLLYTSICLLFCTLSACQHNKEQFRSVSVEEFATLIAEPEVQCLDVRTLAEYSDGHIPGSININVLDKQFENMADSLLQKDCPVALYCRSGKRSKKAAELLARKGYNVYELDKGFQAWQQARQEVEQ